MATYNLGQVAVINRGAWASGTAYAPLNTVTHNGGSFMAIAANTNKEPGVASGWASYWVAMSKGIKTITVSALSTTQAQVAVTFSDGSTATAGTFTTGGIPDGSITTAMIQNHQVTRAKLGTDILPTDVGFYIGVANPPTAWDGTGTRPAGGLAPGQVYFSYTPS